MLSHNSPNKESSHSPIEFVEFKTIRQELNKNIQDLEKENHTLQHQLSSLKFSRGEPNQDQKNQEKIENQIKETNAHIINNIKKIEDIQKKLQLLPDEIEKIKIVNNQKKIKKELSISIPPSFTSQLKKNIDQAIVDTKLAEDPIIDDGFAWDNAKELLRNVKQQNLETLSDKTSRETQNFITKINYSIFGGNNDNQPVESTKLKHPKETQYFLFLFLKFHQEDQKRSAKECFELALAKVMGQYKLNDEKNYSIDQYKSELFSDKALKLFRRDIERNIEGTDPEILFMIKTQLEHIKKKSQKKLGGYFDAATRARKADESLFLQKLLEIYNEHLGTVSLFDCKVFTISYFRKEFMHQSKEMEKDLQLKEANDRIKAILKSSKIELILSEIKASKVIDSYNTEPYSSSSKTGDYSAKSHSTSSSATSPSTSSIATDYSAKSYSTVTSLSTTTSNTTTSSLLSPRVK